MRKLFHYHIMAYRERLGFSRFKLFSLLYGCVEQSNNALTIAFTLCFSIFVDITFFLSVCLFVCLHVQNKNQIKSDLDCLDITLAFIFACKNFLSIYLFILISPKFHLKWHFESVSPLYPDVFPV